MRYRGAVYVAEVRQMRRSSRSPHLAGRARVLTTTREQGGKHEESKPHGPVFAHRCRAMPLGTESGRGAPKRGGTLTVMHGVDVSYLDV